MIQLCFLLVQLLLAFPDHDFHVSRLTMDYKHNENHFELALHVFTDDLEFALMESGLENPKLNTKNEDPNVEKSIISYLNDVLLLKGKNGKAIPLEYLGKESSDDYMATWIYFYWKLPESEDEFHFQHRLLHEIYDDQQNILRITACDPNGLRVLTDNRDSVVINCKKE